MGYMKTIASMASTKLDLKVNLTMIRAIISRAERKDLQVIDFRGETWTLKQMRGMEAILSSELKKKYNDKIDSTTTTV